MQRASFPFHRTAFPFRINSCAYRNEASRIYGPPPVCKTEIADGPEQSVSADVILPKSWSEPPRRDNLQASVFTRVRAWSFLEVEQAQIAERRMQAASVVHLFDEPSMNRGRSARISA